MVKEGAGGGNGNDHRKLEVCVVKYLVHSFSTWTWSSYYLHSFEIVILKTISIIIFSSVNITIYEKMGHNKKSFGIEYNYKLF